MKRMIKYGSIGQFRQTIKDMQYHGNPTVTVELTEKIHGTNGGVSYSPSLGLWAQSKNNIITPENDNAGCAAFVHDRERVFIEIIEDIAEIHGINLDENIITLYFEWCGGNIQKKSAVSGLEKRAILFSHFKVSGLEEEVSDDGQVMNEDWHFLSSVHHAPDVDIYHVLNFDYWMIDIDFANPARSQNEMVELVEKTVEPASPMGREFGIEDNVGEGVVGVFFYNDRLYRFKVKGDKHSQSKVKKLGPANEEEERKINEFVSRAAVAWRLEQAWQETFGIDNEKMQPTVKATGQFMKWFMSDVAKEESDILQEMGLTMKQVSRKLSSVARDWFMHELDREAGLA